MTCDRQLVSNGNPMEAVVGLSPVGRVGPAVSMGGPAPALPGGRPGGAEDAGAGLGDVVRTRTILTDNALRRDAIEAREDDASDVRPIDTIMAAAGFVGRGWPVEVEAGAVIAGRSGRAGLRAHPGRSSANSSRTTA